MSEAACDRPRLPAKDLVDAGNAQNRLVVGEAHAARPLEQPAVYQRIERHQRSPDHHSNWNEGPGGHQRYAHPKNHMLAGSLLHDSVAPPALATPGRGSAPTGTAAIFTRWRRRIRTKK